MYKASAEKSLAEQSRGVTSGVGTGTDKFSEVETHGDVSQTLINVHLGIILCLTSL